jgi:acyl carrier protein
MNDGTTDNLQARLRAFLVKEVAFELDKDPTHIDPRAPISSLGVDSAAAVTITVALERHTGLKLSPALAWDHPTIDELASHVAGLWASAGGPR